MTILLASTNMNRPRLESRAGPVRANWPRRLPLPALLLVGLAATAASAQNLSIADTSVHEEPGSQAYARFTVTLSAPATRQFRIRYRTVENAGSNPATPGVDYLDTMGVAYFDPGDAERTLTVTILNDSHAEPDETFDLVVEVLDNPDIAIVRGRATATILDDRETTDGDDGGGGNGGGGNGNPDGNGGGGNGNPGGNPDGNGGGGNDGGGNGNPGGNPDGNGGGGSDEDGEDDGGDDDDDDNGDKDDDPEPELRIENARVSEDAGSLSFAVRLDRASGVPVTVDWATSAGAATPGEDYAEAGGTLTIEAGTTAGTIQVAVIDDEVDEEDETLTVTLSSPTNATIADGMGAATGTILDNDDAPRIAIADTEAGEGEGGLSFAVTLTTTTAHQVTVDWVTAAGTATPGSGRDYTESSGTLTFMPGQKARTIRVSVRDDRVAEDDETVSVTLSAPTNASIAEGKATGTIVDNDAPPRILVADASASEGAGELEFEVRLEGRSAHPVSIEWATSAGTATPGEDYVEASGVLTLEAAATGGSIAVALLDDTVPEENESLTLTLGNPMNARTRGSAILAMGTIRDDDESLLGAPPEIRLADGAAAESTGHLVLLATLDRAGDRPATVRWATSDGTATAGTDYVQGSGTLTFAAGATSAEIVVGLLDDLAHEDTETFHVTLSDPTNATLGGGRATGLIQDDDGTEPVEAWLARFSRTAASHALEAVAERSRRQRRQGSHLMIAGRRFDLSARESWAGGGASSGLDPTDPLPARIGFGTLLPHGGQPWFAGGAAAGRDGYSPIHGTDPNDLLLRSSFQISGAAGGTRFGPALVSPADEEGPTGTEGDSGYAWSLWGRGAATRFGGGEESLSVGGDVATGTVGIDFERGRVVFGVAASHSFGEGDVLEHETGRRVERDAGMESSLTTGLPYLRVALGENTSIWGVLGRGQGSMKMTRPDLGSVETDIATTMGALGLRRDLTPSASEGPFDLALKADLLVLNATADESVALPELSRDVSRARLTMEGSRTAKLDSGAVLVPSAEVGLRWDTGDAETGGGIEVGAGLRYANPSRGLRMELEGRSLLTHEAGELTEWGVAGALRIDPGPSGRGLSFDLRSSVGNASNGIGRLWEERRIQPYSGNRPVHPRAVAEADLGYRLRVPDDRAKVTPYIGVGLSEQSGRAFRLGVRLGFRNALDLDFECARRVGAGLPSSGLVLGLRGSLRW